MSSKKQMTSYIGIGMAIGTEIIGAEIAGWLVGSWLDEKFNIAPWGSVGSIFLFTIVVIVHVSIIYKKQIC